MWLKENGEPDDVTLIYTCNGVKIRWYRYQLLKTKWKATLILSHLFVCYKWQPLQGPAPAVPVDNKWSVCSTDAIVAVYPTIFHHSLEHNVRGILPDCPPPPSSPTCMLVPLGKRNSTIHPLTRLSTNHLQKQKKTISWEHSRICNSLVPQVNLICFCTSQTFNCIIKWDESSIVPQCILSSNLIGWVGFIRVGLGLT